MSADRASYPSRRRFLAAAGATAGLGLVGAACSGNDRGGPDGTTSTGGGTATTARATGDAAVAEVAAGLEKLAVDTYVSLLTAANSKKLGAVPPAVAELLNTAKAHHDEHLKQWNTVLRNAGRPEVTAPNANLKPTIDNELAAVKDEVGAAKLAYTLEEIASDTYNRAIPNLASREVVKLAAQIQVVDQQHRAILLFALGQYPVPEVFQNTDKAAN
ncbi:MAG: ferritin-like domain-containing protein [Acidimicrobiales bacterium]